MEKMLRQILIVCMIVAVLISCTPKPGPKPQEGTDMEDERPKDIASEDEIPEETKKPSLPKQLQTEDGVEPRLKVYMHETGEVEEMPFEEYVAGVVAGEIKNDWPAEAIKAQAIIARTFVLDFINTKGHSMHNSEAHVSTDIEEAQAWNSEEVNENIKNAVEQTRGQVLTYDGEFTKTWFHSNAGGITADSKEGLNYQEENPPYIVSVESPDTGDEVPEDERAWKASFSKAEVIEALREMGSGIEDFQSISIGQKGPSGRAIKLIFDDVEVSAPDFRVALDSMVMKSTLIDNLEYVDEQLTIEGRGYGHGVGMSQWGAYFMAQEGKDTQQILTHYFKQVSIAQMWE